MKTKFEFFEIEQSGNIATLFLNKPEKRNAMDFSFWRDLPLAIAEIDAEKSIRAFVIAGRGKSFSTGLDVNSFTQEFAPFLSENLAETRKDFYKLILQMQSGINAVYNSNKPSVAFVQKHCIGGGLDLISACDIRYCTEDASFSLREAKVAIVADMGSINRLPAIIGDGNTRELALTGKDIDASEAIRMQLVTKIFPDYDSGLKAAQNTAAEIAENPGFVVEGIKEVMRFAEGKPLEAGLNYVCVWNSSFLASKEFQEAMRSFQNRKKPIYNQT